MGKLLILAALLQIGLSAAAADDGSKTSNDAYGSVGLGVIIGEPTGISFKGWLGSKSAIDAAVAWSFEKHARLHIHADYLLHTFNLIPVEKGRLPMYYGIGGRFTFREDDHDDLIGIRFPIGLEYLFDELPLDIFLELVPVLDLAPKTEVDFNGAIGIRYVF
ncbi:MAG: hypothetical protein ABIE70_07755 [bacterium]